VTSRREQAVLTKLLSDLPGYTPELSPQEHTAAYATLQSFARLAGIIDERLERVPERTFLACLDMLGMHLLPARAARVPLVFSVMPDSPVDVTLPAGSQVAATAPPIMPTLESGEQKPQQTIVFSTESTVTLTAARLACAYSVEPGADRFADHSAGLTSGFVLFDDMKLTPHHLYLGHDTLFALGGHITLIISFVLQQRARSPASIAWEYFTDAGWIPLPFNPEDDTTGGLTINGQMMLRHDCGPNAKKLTVAGRESYWLRARLLTPLIRQGIEPLVTVNDIRVRAAFGKRNLQPDAAFADGTTLDVSKDFYPFGQSPVLASTFYLACKDAFARPGAVVKINFDLSRTGTKQADNGTFTLEWEYSTQEGWEALNVMPANPPYQFDNATPTDVVFTCPSRWAEREVNGVKQRWLRVRIANGDFGKPLRGIIKNGAASFADGNLSPPMVRKARIAFEYLTDPQPPGHCVTYNDFVYHDVTEAARWPDQRFVPFTPVEGATPAVHFGFDRALPVGLASLFLDVPEEEAAALPASRFVWEYRAASGWRELSVLDETHGFRQRGMIQFIGPQDAVRVSGRGDVPLYWLRARLKQGESSSAARCSGLWLNAVWAAERRRVERELAGRSDGNPRQTFQLRRKPVLDGETVEVEEWTGRGEGWRNALPDVAETDIRFERDPATQVPVAAWVRWREREHFYGPGGTGRCYAVERATGILRLGAHVPPAGRRIAVSYASGGGIAGNVPLGSAKQLRTAAPYVAGATNVIAARGGADHESMGDVLRRGPHHLRHRNRGIAMQDLEWLALEASPEVARVRCISVRGPDGRAQRGWVTLLVVPRSMELQPALNGELAKAVREHVAARLPVGAQVRVVGPQYALISIRAIVVPADPSIAALVEARVRQALDRFLHPLQGGRDGRGWMFGESVHLSQVASVIEAVDGVGHAEEVITQSEGALAGMSLHVDENCLVAAGAHELVLRMGVA
jgi:Baseplate J-like protein